MARYALRLHWLACSIAAISASTNGIAISFLAGERMLMMPPAP
jgi:hypothetical protein